MTPEDRAQPTAREHDEDPQTRERWAALAELEEWSELPLALLGLVWLLLLVIELVQGTSPLFDVLGAAIWVVFVLDFVARFLVAPGKAVYLRRNVLTVISLILPGLRVFRIARSFRLLRLARTTRSLSFVRIVTSFRRGVRSLGATMSSRGLGHVLALTALVTVLGAAGMYAFESTSPATERDRGFASYGEALWWTAMLLTTLGSDYWPQSSEGRLLTLLLAAYGLGVFGYIAGALASFFVGREAALAARDSPPSPARGQGLTEAEESELRELRREVAALREELARPE